MVATDIRKEARESLKNKWVKAILIILIQFLITGLLTGIENALGDNSILTSIISIIEVVIGIPLSFGMVAVFMKLKRNEEVNYFDFIKIGFDNFTRAWGLCFRTLLKMILPIICVVLAIIIVTIMFTAGGIVGIAMGAGQQALGLVIIGIIIYVVALAYAVTIGLKYALTVCIAYDNPDMTTQDAVEKSAELMVGHRGDLFVLLLSFLGWALLCYLPLVLATACILVPVLAIVFMVGAVCGLLCLVAYIQIAKICFYDDVLKLNSEKTTVEVQK